MSETGEDSTLVCENMPTEAPQVSTIVQVAMTSTSVPANIFIGTLQGILGFANIQVRVLVDVGCDSQQLVMYWKFTDIKQWRQLKSETPASRGGIYYGDMKIKCFQALAWWVTDLTLQGKIIDLDYFKTDILADAIEESTLDFEDTRDGKRELSKPRSVLEFLLQAYELNIKSFFHSLIGFIGLDHMLVIFGLIGDGICDRCGEVGFHMKSS